MSQLETVRCRRCGARTQVTERQRRKGVCCEVDGWLMSVVVPVVNIPANRGPCSVCESGVHSACTGVGCFGCRDGHRLLQVAS